MASLLAEEDNAFALRDDLKTLPKHLTENHLQKNDKQDGRLAPAYFSPNYKYFDQLLQTVKNKTTVLILVFKEFLQTSIRPLISVLYAKGYHDFPMKNFLSHSVEKFGRGTFLCCVSENFW